MSVKRVKVQQSVVDSTEVHASLSQFEALVSAANGAIPKLRSWLQATLAWLEEKEEEWRAAYQEAERLHAESLADLQAKYDQVVRDAGSQERVCQNELRAIEKSLIEAKHAHATAVAQLADAKREAGAAESELKQVRADVRAITVERDNWKARHDVMQAKLNAAAREINSAPATTTSYTYRETITEG
jgi:hypothetical protein